jgi:hypothetical protein
MLQTMLSFTLLKLETDGKFRFTLIIHPWRFLQELSMSVVCLCVCMNVIERKFDLKEAANFIFHLFNRV